MCGGQKAYPVYVSFGNLDKDWRRKPSKHGMYLLGYLPVDAFEDVADDDERRRLKAELVHRAMEKMLLPLREASEQGVEMWCPDGRLRRIFPRVAAYTADWPEQSLQCCTSEGGCPICKTSNSVRGQIEDEIELREREETLEALRTYVKTQNEAHLNLLHLKPVWPWWGDLPDVNLSACFAPDLLHQAYQGLFKTHLRHWMNEIIGTDVLDDRYAAMPRAEGLRHFGNGASSIPNNRWTGRESKELLAQFFPTVVGDLTPEMTQMVRALVDFMYRGHAATLTESDLVEMDNDLGIFHELKGTLIGKVYEDKGRFNKIAKLHMLRHWTHSIRELGTPDGFNTEIPEHLHIEYAKVPWRASNKVKPLPQMVKYIQRQEAIRVHRAILDRYLAGNQNDNSDERDEGDELEESDLVDVISDDPEYGGGIGDMLESDVEA
ncbi:putative Zn-finger protein, partial [Rhizoctonia solani 123E]